LICDVIYSIFGLFHQVQCEMHTSDSGHFKKKFKHIVEKKSDIVTKSELVSVNATLGAQHKQYHALLIYCCDFGTQRAFWPRWAREGGLGRHAGGALFL